MYPYMRCAYLHQLSTVAPIDQLQWSTTVSNLGRYTCRFIYDACVTPILMSLYAPILVHITLSRVQSHVQTSSAHACSYAPILVHM